MGEHLAKICMLADSHGLYDDRIYWKEAVSLKKEGYDVHYILAGDVNDKGITHEGISFEIVRRDRFKNNPYLNYFSKRLPGGLYPTLYRRAAEWKADVYHIHDLKVLRIGKTLKALGSQPKVVYDVHEPYPENILDYWESRGFAGLFRKPWSEHIKKWERRAAAQCDLIITTEENLQQRFLGYFPDKPVEIIYNYTNLPEVDAIKAHKSKEWDAIYTGGITKFRGAWKILEALNLAKKTMPGIRILFLGSWFPEGLKRQMESYIEEHGLSNQVVMMDAVPYGEVSDYYRKSKVGLGIFLPIHTHRIILQIKLFEYMNFGLPIVGSNFGHVSSLIQRHQCGVTVDPLNPKDIAEGILGLLSDEEKCTSMGNKGIKAAKAHYRWTEMEDKLIRMYHALLNPVK